MGLFNLVIVREVMTERFGVDLHQVDAATLAKMAPALVAQAITQGGMKILDQCLDFFSLESKGAQPPPLTANELRRSLRGTLSQKEALLRAADRRVNLWSEMSYLDPGKTNLCALFHDDSKPHEILADWLNRALEHRRPHLEGQDPFCAMLGKGPENSPIISYPDRMKHGLQSKIPLQFLRSGPEGLEVSFPSPPRGALLVFASSAFSPEGTTVDETSAAILYRAKRRDVTSAILSGSKTTQGGSGYHLWMGTSDRESAAAWAHLLTDTPLHQAHSVSLGGEILYRFPGQLPQGPQMISLFFHPSLRKAHVLAPLYHQAYKAFRKDMDAISRREEIFSLLTQAEGVSRPVADFLKKSLDFQAMMEEEGPLGVDATASNRLALTRRLYHKRVLLPPGMKDLVETSPFGATSDIGRRPEQQDHYLLKELGLPSEISFLASLGDGHGALGRKACRQVLHTYETKVTELLLQMKKISLGGIRAAARQAINFTDISLRRHLGLAEGGTTLVSALRWGKRVIVTNIGDSRLYHLSSHGSIFQVTRDHNWPDHKYHYGWSVSRSLGDFADKHSRSEFPLLFRGRPDIFVIEVEEGDSLLLCSDGLNVLYEDDISDLVQGSHPQRAAEDLVREAKQAWEQAPRPEDMDNMTALVIRI